MNTYLKYTLLILGISAVTACDDYRFDDYAQDFDYTAVYFPHQQLTRTFVYGEFDHIQVAVQMGGRRTNNRSEWVAFEIDNEMSVDGYTMLPSSHYALSDDDFFPIKPGDLGGELTLTVNKAFFEDIADGSQFYIPFRLNDTSVDSILTTKDTMILELKVEAAHFGNYYHNGRLTVDSVGGGQEVIHYHQDVPVTNEINNWELTSVSYDTLKTNGIANQKSGVSYYGFHLVIGDDGNVGIYPSADSEWQVTANGSSVIDTEKKELYLNYKYQDTDGNAYTVADTLIFRNRILDGVNQWW
ncbi:MAG: DUF1735 domain-containing protein [Cyclobacteriaceae bacterium]